ncbi:MBOAT, membrane-bound O-acyltransferase family-domain-containing protein [Zychaea mexicana]|uniref:MBOAT, membrane-bound O-acyltransferase family-domain-containing protein n=1 Tax=Zychaea mexicana TaxID=64656 RepID=UPI0022FEC29A|nr:MBOAT, membrane-bound O-acyltransferase family-domain-containing protein [Zychaea mexicana]KAI9488524.1 MBOAT, membrane-bound O-acyltransferase family-domain-containing protein [Zychaea mexicana]
MSHSPTLFKSALLKSAAAHSSDRRNPEESSDDAASIASYTSEPSLQTAKEELIEQANAAPAPGLQRPPITKTFSVPTTTTTASSGKHSITYQLNKHRRILFKARMSKFDISNPETSSDTFRGFYTLFWIVMGIYIIQSGVRCYEQEGVVLSLGFFRLFSKDGLALLISDMAMVATTVTSVMFSKLLVWGVIPYEPVGVVLQHVCQTVFLFLNIYWTFWREWPWVQSGFFTLHTIVMMMKMHSYTSLNGELSIRYRRLKYLKEHVPKWITEHKGDNDDSSKSQELKEMETEMTFLEDELVHGNVRFPDNVTLLNYLDYLLVPSLVYALEYPPIFTEFPSVLRIRPWYVLEKSLATLGSFLLLYVTTERYILPKLYDPDMSDFRVIVELLFPFMINYLFIFYIIFECILNAFAELSRFADRNFYDDWWNSVSYDEFARKWNKPVHQWLLRHVYAQSMESYQLSKWNATLVTFLFSSCLHELVLVIVTRRVRMYLFAMQMFQLPLIVLGQHPLVRKHSTTGNVLLWLGMFIGLPLLAILYCREAFWSDAMFGVGDQTIDHQ